TFILVFARWPVVWTGVPHTVMLYVQPCCLMFLVLAMVGQLAIPTWFLFALHVGSFFATALVCHGELARDRPAARYLTEFYLWMSVGGVLGGMFNALIAPLAFSIGVIEYPLAMALACVLRPSLVGNKPLVQGDSDDTHKTPVGVMLTIILPAALGLFAYLGAWYSQDRYLKDVLPFIGANYFLRPFLLALPIVAVLGLASRPLRFGLGLACVFLGVGLFDRTGEDRVYESRGFFGFVKVRHAVVTYDEGLTRYTYNVLIHGGIDHGRQNLHFRRRPISYFHPTGGIGQLFTKFSWPDQRLPASLVGLGNVPYGVLAGVHSEPPYAVVGLGTGTLAAYARPYQHVVFYEIDPQIKALSLPKDGGKPIFSYLQDALDREANLEVVLGDGRLSLQKAPDKYFHILALDAFSSDAIPVHLLTQEALDLYLSKVADGGAIIFNTTNRYVEIRPVLADLANSRGLEWAYFGDYGTDEEGNVVPEKFSSDWLVMRRRGPAGNGGPPLAERLPGWREYHAPGRRPWSDSYSNLLGALVW
ncbi:MAG: hypothetical protein HY040_20725, partial [Planctomycetes bacterium]|nr:hypothetical protein [Planctomycetota bacterium]